MANVFRKRQCLKHLQISSWLHRRHVVTTIPLGSQFHNPGPLLEAKKKSQFLSGPLQPNAPWEGMAFTFSIALNTCPLCFQRSGNNDILRELHASFQKFLALPFKSHCITSFSHFFIFWLSPLRHSLHLIFQTVNSSSSVSFALSHFLDLLLGNMFISLEIILHEFRKLSFGCSHVFFALFYLYPSLFSYSCASCALF